MKNQTPIFPRQLFRLQQIHCKSFVSWKFNVFNPIFCTMKEVNKTWSLASEKLALLDLIPSLATARTSHSQSVHGALDITIQRTFDKRSHTLALFRSTLSILSRVSASVLCTATHTHSHAGHCIAVGATTCWLHRPPSRWRLRGSENCWHDHAMRFYMCVHRWIYKYWTIGCTRATVF